MVNSFIFIGNLKIFIPAIGGKVTKYFYLCLT